MKKTLVILLVTLSQGCGSSNSPCPIIKGLDTVCRVVDSKENGEFLVETYRLDESGQEKLYIWKNDKLKIQIEHPFGKVQSYADNINQGKAEQNQIEFDESDSKVILVNKLKFPINEISEP